MNEMRKVVNLQDQTIRGYEGYDYTTRHNTYHESYSVQAKKEFEREYSKAYMKLLSNYKG